MVAKVLNPSIFRSGVMRPEVREKLLEISDLFLSLLREESQLDIVPIDVILVGSNASYNYTDESDIDLHLVVNFDTLPACPDELIQAFCNSEKSNFNRDYDFTVHGCPVEVYVEDVKTTSVTKGIYSLFNNEWVKFPTQSDSPEVPDVSQTPEYFDIYEETTEVLLSGDLTQVRNMIDRLYLLRKNSLSVYGESGRYNLIFKELRRQGVLDDLKDKYKELVSAEYSLESLKEDYNHGDYTVRYLSGDFYIVDSNDELVVNNGFSTEKEAEEFVKSLNSSSDSKEDSSDDTRDNKDKAGLTDKERIEREVQRVSQELKLKLIPSKDADSIYYETSGKTHNAIKRGLANYNKRHNTHIHADESSGYRDQTYLVF